MRAVQLRAATNKSPYQQDERCAHDASDEAGSLTSLIPAEDLSEVQRCTCPSLLMAAACANIATLAFSKPAAISLLPNPGAGRASRRGFFIRGRLD